MSSYTADEYDHADGWHSPDPDGWADDWSAMDDDRRSIEPLAWLVPGWPCPVWTDGDDVWLSAFNAAHAEGVERVEGLDAWRVLVTFASGETAEMLRHERLYVAEVER